MLAKPPFTDVPSAIEEIRDGRMIVIVDDEDRENEGDLMLPAEKVTPEAINFMAKYGRGLICLTLTEERLEHLLTPLLIGAMGTCHFDFQQIALSVNQDVSLASPDFFSPRRSPSRDHEPHWF